MRITILGPQRRKPRIGDRQVTKKHGLRVRVVETHNGMWVKSGSRYRYEWVRPADLDAQWLHLLTPAEKADREQVLFMRRHRADIEKSLFFGAQITPQPPASLIEPT